MLREHRALTGKVHLFLDFLCILLAWSVSYVCLQISGESLQSPGDYFPHFTWFSFGTVYYLFAKKFRPDEYLVYSFQLVREIVFSVFVGLFFMSGGAYFLKLQHASRLYIATSSTSSLLFLLLWNFFVHWFFRQVRQKGLNYQHLLLVGNAYTLPPVIGSIHNNPTLGQKIEAIILTESDAVTPDLKDFNVYQGMGEIKEVLNRHVIDNALFTVYRQSPIEVERTMLACQERGINVWLKPDFMHGVLVSRVDYLADIPLFVFALGPKYGLSLALKRVFDFIIAAVGLAILAFPMLIVAALVRTTPGPVFFRQKRVGLNGRRFTIFKFRTMYKDAEQRRAEYNLKNEMQGPAFKMKNDPRITPVGKFLRKYSLDELPQIWNVLIGNMSLVGPRPPLPTEVELYEGWQRRRISMRPGITCIWQVTGRNKITDFNEWTRLDLKYIDEWSPLLDLMILLKTIPVVLAGTGL